MDTSAINPTFWINNEEECLNHILSEDVLNAIPLLNECNVQSMPHNALVRFRGMVQDMFNPDYYFDKYVVVDRNSKEKSFRCGRYCDTLTCESHEEIDFESLNNVSKERSTFVVISIPGLNSWAQTRTLEQNVPEPADSNTQSSHKRAADADMEVEGEETSKSNGKKVCTEKPTGTESNTMLSHEYISNLPLPGSKGDVCHVKIYKNAQPIKVNHLVECIGFLSLDPILSQPHEEPGDNEMEVQTHNPPPSLVPRIHCVHWRMLKHVNPLIATNEGGMDCEKMVFLKRELHIVLTQLFLGDQLAAEYFMYYLISKVYARSDLLALGKFTLNISNVPVDILPNYGEQLYEFMQLLVPKSYYLPMSLANMNGLVFTPKKDYTANRLTSGLLQLSENTHLLLDETKLETGRLKESGVRAINTLSNAIRFQKVRYDFTYYELEYDCDIPFLIVSEGKSLLPKDFYLPLRCDETCTNTFEEIVSAAKHFLKPELLNDLRVYITVARQGKFDLSDSMQEVIQNDFVKLRQEKNVSADTLHELLVLARLLCLSEGKDTLDETSWKRVYDLENQRKSRV